MTTSFSKALTSKSTLKPIASDAEKKRKQFGDEMFPVFADKLISGVKQRRESRANDKAMGY